MISAPPASPHGSSPATAVPRYSPHREPRSPLRSRTPGRCPRTGRRRGPPARSRSQPSCRHPYWKARAPAVGIVRAAGVVLSLRPLAHEVTKPRPLEAECRAGAGQRIIRLRRAQLCGRLPARSACFGARQDSCITRPLGVRVVFPLDGRVSRRAISPRWLRQCRRPAVGDRSRFHGANQSGPIARRKRDFQNCRAR